MFAAIIAKTRKYIRIFKNQGAISPATSIIPAEYGIRHTLVFKKLLRQGIIIQAGNEKYYLDEIKEEQVRNRRQKLLLTIFMSLLITGILIYLFTRYPR